VTVSDNFALLAHAELMKSCDVPESNGMMTGCPNSKNVPSSTSSHSGISLTMVWLARPLLVVGALNWPLWCFTIHGGTLGDLPFLDSQHC
jgi:hypothetical protein